MLVAKKQQGFTLQLKYLAGFAEFLKSKRLKDFISIQIRYSREMKLPLLRFFESMSDDQLVEMSIPSTTEFLDSLINGEAKEHIVNANKKWLANQLEIVDKHDINVSDISLVSFIRKKSMLSFLPEYTAILTDALAIINEIDALNLESDLNATNTYINILKEQIDQHSHFIERITETSPGIIYVFDLINNKEVYANEMMTRLLGYETEDWKKLQSSFVSELIHPEDVAVIEANQKAFATTPDGEVRTIKYRIKDKSGKYRWMQTHESVFKRTTNGATWQVIGIALDISIEKQTADQLQKREDQLLEAQTLADIGSFVWNTNTNEREATAQFYKILNVEKGIPMESFLAKVHPADRGKVKAAFEATIHQQNPLDIEFRYIDQGKEKIVWFKAACEQDEAEHNIVKGTVMNVSERHTIVQRLQRSEDINKKAQALIHLGNWTWDLINNKIEWSDELYKIYGLIPGTGLSDEFIRSFNHPEDAEKIAGIMAESLQTHQPYDFYYRIIAKDATVKTLHANGEVLVDENGKPYKMIGTLQDVSEREQLIQRLQRSEALYKQAQSIAHLGNWIFDVESEKLFWTDELYRIYGLDPQSEELVWSKFINLVLEDDKPIVTAFSEEVLKNGKSFEMYHRIKRVNDNAIRTLHVRGEGLTDENGKVYQLFGTTQDVTEQQRIEQELRQNQNFIKKIADATPSIIASYNINTGKYSFVSQGIQSLLGYEPEDVLEKGVEFFATIVHPEDLEEVMKKNAEALIHANLPENEEQDIIVEFQYRMKRADGEYRWFHTFGTVFDRNAKGKVENVLNISIDITDRIKAEETVAEQQKFISHIAEASPTILYLFDLEQKKFLYLNKEVTVVLGYRPEEILSLGDKVYMYLHPDDNIKSAQTYVRYKQDGAATMHQFEVRIRSRSGEWKWLLTREVVFKRNEEGKAIQVLGSALDITQRKEMEGSLSKKNNELEQSNANLEEFAYVASHDLQEPLRKISIFGDRLLVNHKEQLNEDGQLFLQKIVDSSKRMQVMINDLLAVSLLSSDKSFQLYSLKAALDDALQTLEFKIEAKKATIKADDLPEANVIPSQMRQLFQNLISNSLKFVSPDRLPQINITCSKLKQSDIQILSLPAEKQYIRIDIADNGIGFQNEYASKIFTIFQRLHGKFDYEGTGIGLAICKKIVEIHEGTIFAEGKPGEGAVFSIVIPV